MVIKFTGYSNTIKRLIWIFGVFITIWGSNLKGISIGGVTFFPLRVIIVLWIGWKLFFHNRISINRQKIYLLVFFISGCMATLWSYDPKTSVSTLLIYLTDIFTFIIACEYLKSEENIIAACNAIQINALLLAFLAIYEAFNGYLFGASYSWMIRDRNLLGLYMPKTIFFNVNNLAVFMISCLPFFFLVKSKNYIFRVISVVMIISAALLTESRTAILAVVLFFICLLIYNFKYENGSTKIKVLLFLLIVLCVVIYFAPNIIDILSKGNLALNISEESRWSIWKNILSYSAEYYFWGSGPGTCGVLYFAAHNLWLEVLCEFGIIGFLAFLGFILDCFFNRIDPILFRSHRVIIAGFVVFLVSTICQSSLQQSYYLWIMFALYYSKKRFDNKL